MLQPCPELFDVLESLLIKLLWNKYKVVMKQVQSSNTAPKIQNDIQFFSTFEFWQVTVTVSQHESGSKFLKLL